MLLALVAHLIIDAFRERAALIAELLFLRHENAVLRRRKSARINLTNIDGWFLTWFFRLWPEVTKRSLLVSPGTLLRWHRQGFRSYWRWKSRAQPGRPKIDRATIALIKRIARENGTIRRECLDHVLILNENHLRRTLSAFADHYNADRTHLSLGKDAPDRRAIEREGEVISINILGGLHHRYGRRAIAKDSNIR